MFGCLEFESWKFGCLEKFGEVWMFGCLDVWRSLDVWMFGEVWMFGCWDVGMFGGSEGSLQHARPAMGRRIITIRIIVRIIIEMVIVIIIIIRRPIASRAC